MVFEFILLILIVVDYFSYNSFFKTLENKVVTLMFLSSIFLCTSMSIHLNIFNNEYVLPVFIVSLLIIHIHRNRVHLHMDSLTKLLNRRSFDLMMKYRDCKKSITVIYIDVNDFKQINDLYGHEEGDRVLKSVADVLRQTLRREDHIYRVGGDEFVITASIRDEKEVKRVLDNIKTKISEDEYLKRFHVTLGIGYAVDGKINDLKTMIKEADNWMYTDKQKKKNKK